MSKFAVVLILASFLPSCGKGIRYDAAPANCMAIIFETDDSLDSKHIHEIENFARGLRGYEPYPEVSFQMAKGVSGKTVFRAIRKDDIDIHALKLDINTWLKQNDYLQVTVRVISTKGEVKFHASNP